MKTIKIAFALAAALLLSSAGCDNKKADEATPTTEPAAKPTDTTGTGTTGTTPPATGTDPTGTTPPATGTTGTTPPATGTTPPATGTDPTGTTPPATGTGEAAGGTNTEEGGGQ